MTRAVALLLTLMTGFTGLVYEVSWQKYLATLLGSHAEATVAVLAIFLGGLSMGYALFGRVSRGLARRRDEGNAAGRILRTYGALECGIGLYAFLFPWLFALARAVSHGLPLSEGPVAFGMDIVLAAILIGPPAVLMGGTIPMLTEALSRSLAEATRFHALVYGLNTAGAFAGALAAGFWLIPTLGLDGSLAAMGVINVGAGLLFVVLGRTAGSWATTATADVKDRVIEGFSSYAGVAVLNGFAMMALQVVFIRVGGFSLGSSHFTFAMVVAVFVLCIALGSLLVSPFRNIRPLAIVATQWALVGSLILLYPFLEDAPYYAHVLRTQFGTRSSEFTAYYGSVFLWLLVVLGPPVLLSGAILPLLFGHLRRQVGELGSIAGRLYSWNTVGSLLGALVGGYLLLFWIDLDAVYRVAAGALALAAVLLSLRVFEGRARVLTAVPAIVMAALLLWLTPWSPQRLSSGLFRYREAFPVTDQGAAAFFSNPAFGLREVLFYTDDPVMSVAVFDQPIDTENPASPLSRSIVTNGKSDSSVQIDAITLSLLALLPAVHAERLARVFVIGFGTGVTAGEFAALDSVEEVVVAEISPGVLEAAPYFADYNHDVLANPKVRIIQADAYRALQRSDGLFDVISAEPSNPWVTGVEMLYSREFLETLKSRLAPGGVSVQWIHLYEIDSETLELVLRTYLSVFDRVSLWYGDRADLLILGHPGESRGGELERFLARVARPDIRAGLARVGLESPEALAAHELVPEGVMALESLAPGPVHTLQRPILSDRAARAFFRGGRGQLPYVGDLSPQQALRWISTIRALDESAQGLSPEAYERYVDEVCRHRPLQCAVVLADWRLREPESAFVRRAVVRHRAAGTEQSGLGVSLLRDLKLLLQDSAEEDVTVEHAERLTRSFEAYYHYGIPFDRAQLDRLLSRCRAPSGRAHACEALRRASDERFARFPANPGG